MMIVARRFALAGSCAGLVLSGASTHAAPTGRHPLAQKWIDGWNATDPAKLVSAFTPDGIYEDIPFVLKKKGSAELRELHKYFHDSVGGLYVKLIAAYVAEGHGTIEWLFGGQDLGVYKTGKPFEVQGVSVIEVRNGRIARNLDYYDAVTIMKQVGKLPA